MTRARSSSWRRRSFNSPAALLVNVTATIWLMVVRPVASTATMRAISSVVLPVPAEASTSRLSASEVRMRSRAARSSSCGCDHRCHESWRMPNLDQRVQTIRLVCVSRAFLRRGRRPRCNRTARRRRFAGRRAENPSSMERSMVSSTRRRRARDSSLSGISMSEKSPRWVQKKSRPDCNGFAQ